MRTTSVLVLVLAGCPGPAALDAGPDAARLDAPTFDAFDAPSDVAGDAPDAPIDAPLAMRDAPLDAPLDTPLDGGRDTGVDAPILRDAGADGGVDAGGGSTIVQCAPPIPAGASSGLVCSAGFWPGFQFEITADRHLIGLGVQGAVDGSMPASVHATLFRIAGPGATPMLADPGSVVTRQLITLPNGTPMIGTASADVILPPGWYALVVGTGAHGATATSATLPSGGGGGCTSTPGSGFPFTVRLMDGMYILQGASPHLFVVLE